MSWLELERSFARALFLSVSKRKLLLTFPVLVLCGILIVFCRAAAFESSDWMAMSFAFLPILLSSVVLLALGVLLVRIHDHEVRSLSLSFRRLIAGSLDLMLGTSYWSIPSLIAYFFLWILMGIFFLFKEIPLIGDFFSVAFSFGPFLLILCSICLCVLNFGVLFFVAPASVLQPLRKVSMARRVLSILRARPLTSLALFFVAMAPNVLLVGLLSLAALLTNGSFLVAERSLSVALEWFFIMVPFCALLTPGIIFFFNFAAEAHRMLSESLQAGGHAWHSGMGRNAPASGRAGAAAMSSERR